MENKPVSVIRKELEDTLTDVINSYRLPAFILAPLLKDLYQEAQRMVEIEYQRDLAQYEQDQNEPIQAQPIIED